MAANKRNTKMAPNRKKSTGPYKRPQNSSKPKSKSLFSFGRSHFNLRRLFRTSAAVIFVVLFAALGVHFLHTGHGYSNQEIKSAEPGDFCMELDGDEQHDGATIRTAPCDGRDAEHFYWGSGPGSAQGIHWSSNWCIQPQNGGTAPDTQVVLSACQNGRAGQAWHIHDLPGTNYGEYRNDNAYGPNNQAMCLTIPSGNTGAQLQIRACGGTSTSGNTDQMWHQETYGGGGGTPSGSTGCRNPLRDVSGLNAERIDGGVDYGGSGPVHAICPGHIKEVYGAGWPGGIYIDETVNQTGSSAANAVDWYVAEDCSPNVSVGQNVTTDTVICHMFGGSSGIETGWSDPHQQQHPLSYVYGGNGSCGSTALGTNSSQFLHRQLGAPAGVQGGSCGYLPSGWPSW